MNFVNNFSSTIVSERLPGDVDAGVSPPFGRAGVGIPLLRQYWRIAVRRKWVIAGVIAASFMLGLIITLLMTPLYTATARSEEHTSELQSLMRISYAVFCLKKNSIKIRCICNNINIKRQYIKLQTR